MTNLRSLVERWYDASGRQVAILREPSPPSRWPLLGMFAIGLVVVVIGSYAVTQRSHIKLLARRAFNVTPEVRGEFGGVEVAKPVSVTSPRSNHRRKAAVEVTS